MSPYLPPFTESDSSYWSPVQDFGTEGAPTDAAPLDSAPADDIAHGPYSAAAEAGTAEVDFVPDITDPGMGEFAGGPSAAEPLGSLAVTGTAESELPHADLGAAGTASHMPREKDAGTAGRDAAGEAEPETGSLAGAGSDKPPVDPPDASPPPAAGNEEGNGENPERSGEGGRPGDRPTARIEVHERDDGSQVLTGEIVDNNFDRWQWGVPVESLATAVDRLPELTPRQQEILQGIQVPYKRIHVGNAHEYADLPDTHARTGFTAEQLHLIGDVDTAFMTAITEYAQAHGLGEVLNPSHLITAGIFDPDTDSLDWHVDPSSRPSARFIATLGDAGATNFAVGGSISRGDTDKFGTIHPGVITIGPGGNFRQIEHGTGVISGFLPNQTAHCTPARGGIRLVITATVTNALAWMRQRGSL